MDASSGELKPIPRNPFRFDLLHLFEFHRRTKGGSLQDPNAPGDFIASLGQPLTDAVSDPNLLRGLQVEALFGALAVSLGRIALLKHEDSGEAWADGRLHVPDYRLVLPDGSQFLAEIKHFHQKGDPQQQCPMTGKYRDGLQRYEDLIQSPIRVAVYWSRWNLWTLVPLSAFEGSKGKLALSDAAKLNEMGILGDQFISTDLPLRLRFEADTNKERKVGADGQVRFTIGGVEMYSGDKRLTQKREQNIAMWLMLFGQWQEDTSADIKDGELVYVDFVMRPREPSGEQFDLVGILSSMFTRMYLNATTEGAAITRLGIEVKSGTFGALVPNDYESEALSLWRFELTPPSTLSLASPSEE